MVHTTKNKRGRASYFGFSKGAGFTLIEVIVYMALFSLVMGGLLLATYDIVSGSGNLQSKAFINQESEFLVRKLDWALTGASAISVPDATTILITQPNLPGSDNPVDFSLAGDGLMLKEGAAPAARLNSESMQMTSLVFTYIPPSGSKPAGLRAQFTLKNVYKSQSFDTTIYLHQ